MNNSRKLVSFDFAMKSILRQKANFVILEGFLSELLLFDVKIEEVLESEANQHFESDKFNRVDLLAKTPNDELILIEVQYSHELDYFQRMLFGSSKLIIDYVDSGESYENIKKVYSVNLIYFNLGVGEDYLYYGKTDFIGLNNEQRLELSNKQKKDFKSNSISDIFPEYYLIQIDKFKKKLPQSKIDEWIYFFKTEKIEKCEAKGLCEANEKLAYLKLNEKDRIAYDKTLKWESVRKSEIRTARIDGETNKAYKIAKNSLKAGLDIQTIITITGLSIEEIENLK